MLQPRIRVAAQAACRAQLLAVARRVPAARQTHSPSTLRIQPRQSQPRWLVTSSRRAQDDRTSRKADVEIDGESSSSFKPDEAPPTSSEADNLPWYLKVDVPKHPTLVPQETPLPDIPENSPSLMHPMLTFIAEDLGLDELSILDLRALDPPSGLGPELIMLFGTARSERHLHVSADRLVRWLRKHGIRANADGLLGRNELKIKLRRKARRAKLLGGAPPAASMGPGQPVDDGISTQWVCLHAGTLSGKATSTTEGSLVDEDGRVSGFGSVNTGTTVVVQMLTEAKRKQIDLETLWTRTLERSLRGLGPEPESENDGFEELEAFAAVPASEPRQTSQTTAKSSAKSQQQRFFSTSARQLDRGHTKTRDTGEMELLSSKLSLDRLAELGNQLSNSRDEKLHLLERLASYLKGLPANVALQELGHSTNQSVFGMPVASTFSRVSSFCLRDLSAADSWAFRSSVYSKGLQIGCPGYTLAGMGELVREMQTSGVQVSGNKAAELLRGIFSVSVTKDSLPQMCSTTLNLLDTLQERGRLTLETDLAMAAVAGLSQQTRLRPDRVNEESSYVVLNSPGSLKFEGGMAPDNENTEPVDRLQDALEDMVRQAHLPCPSEEAVMEQLTTYAKQDNWDRFWGAWRVFPQSGVPRTRSMYAHLFNTVAETKNEVRCIEAVRWCFHEMMVEEPRVMPTGGVLRALKACISVADPKAEEYARVPITSKEMFDRVGHREMPRLLREIEKLNL